MLTVLHGVGVFKVLAILVGNYYAAKATKPPGIERFWPAIVIVANMAILFANWKFDGYKFGALHSALGDLDALTGILPRWHIGFNITMLRIVSFAIDYHWRAAPPSSPPTDHRGRTGSSLHESDYNLVNFIAYALYPPLYIAGPILTFQDFMWQLHRPLDITTRERISYAVRFVFCLLTMESILHTMYVTAIKDTRAWQGASPADLSMIGFWNLVIVWLKVGFMTSLKTNQPAPHPLALLPPLVAVRRYRPAREHDPLRRKQLLDPRLLALVAQKLQPLGCEVSCGLWQPRTPHSHPQVHLHPTRWREEHDSCDAYSVHVRRPVARPLVQAPGMGLARQPVHSSRAHRPLPCPSVQGKLHVS